MNKVSEDLIRKMEKIENVLKLIKKYSKTDDVTELIKNVIGESSVVDVIEAASACIPFNRKFALSIGFAERVIPIYNSVYDDNLAEDILNAIKDHFYSHKDVPIEIVAKIRNKFYKEVKEAPVEVRLSGAIDAISALLFLNDFTYGADRLIQVIIAVSDTLATAGVGTDEGKVFEFPMLWRKSFTDMIIKAMT